MEAGGLLCWNASPESETQAELPAMKKSISMKKYEARSMDDNTGEIEYSHGKTWFRCPMIGQGGQGSVYLTEPKTTIPADSEFPFPMVVKSAIMAHSSSIQFEKKILSVLNGCPYLVRCFGDEITETKSGEKIYNLLIEYCSGGSLFDHITKSKNGLPEAEVISYARDIARGLNYMHSNGYAHCDIKPENILLVPQKTSSSTSSEKEKYVAKIADFGLSLMLFKRDEDCGVVRGTSGYYAPEVVRYGEIDWPADIWSFGCTVLEMLTGEPAWGVEIMEKSTETVIDHIAYSYETPIIPDNISEKAKDFLKNCFDPDSGYNRWPAWKLLKHPFLSQSTADRSSRCYELRISIILFCILSWFFIKMTAL